MLNSLLILTGKVFSKICLTANLGSGSTWPGNIALEANKNFIKDLIKKNSSLKIVVIAGTNGKTTTGKLIQTILEKNGDKVFQNKAGANLLNGIASSLLLHTAPLSTKINYDYAIFEVDENSLPLVLNELTPDYLILLNLFRDQLDRYGEIDSIAKKWEKAIHHLPSQTNLILNADDPKIAFLGKDLKNKTYYFGAGNGNTHRVCEAETTDSTYCPNCNQKLNYQSITFSHLGNWICPNCKLKRPTFSTSNISKHPLPGIYNIYNTEASVLFATINNINNSTIQQSFNIFTPAFGRQEEIEVNGKIVKIFLSKNPTSFNESLRTIKELDGKNLLIVLNDKIPDGRDVSWIWDTDIESNIDNFQSITVSGDRCYDMGLRIKYAFNETQNSSRFNRDKIQKSAMKQFSNLTIEANLKKAISLSLSKTPQSEILYILPTYSAMLEVRKILTGRKIL